MGGNGGVAHVARTQVSRLLNGTSQNVSASTAGKIVVTETVNAVPSIGLNVATGAVSNEVSNNLPEASLNCALGTDGC